MPFFDFHFFFFKYGARGGEGVGRVSEAIILRESRN